MPTLDESIELAKRLHAGESFIEHALCVLRALPDDVVEDDRHLAMLHDAVQDCPIQLATLMTAMQSTFDPANPVAYLDFFRRRGYSNYVVQGLMLLTQDMWKGSHMRYIRNIIEAEHRGAMLVKYNCHNCDLQHGLPDQSQASINRHQRSMQALAAALHLDSGTSAQ